ncbi:Chitin synthase, class 5 [Clarireedia jacksonii]
MIGPAEARAILSKIKPPESLPWAQVPKGKVKTGFTAHIAPYHAYNIFNKIAIDSAAHHQHHKVCYDLIRKTKHPLWFSVSTSKANGGNLKVVRSLIQRRIRAAFTSALLKHGCDIHGKKLPDVAKKNGDFRDIHGTIYAHSTEFALKMKMEDLEAQAESVVGQLITRMNGIKIKNPRPTAGFEQNMNVTRQGGIAQYKNPRPTAGFEQNMNATRQGGIAHQSFAVSRSGNGGLCTIEDTQEP